MTDDSRFDEGFGIEPDDAVETETTTVADDTVDDEIPAGDDPSDADLQDEPEPEQNDGEQPEENDNSEVEASEDEAIAEEEIGKFKIIGQLPVFDKLGGAIPPVAIGSVQEYPVSYGNDLVDQGLAEKVEE